MLAVVAPLAIPQFDALLLGLLILCGFIVAAGLVYTLHGFVRGTVGGIAKLVGRIPGVGGVLSSPVNAVYHWMNHEFGAVEAALDKRISNYFHQLAKLVQWFGDELARHANLLYLVSTLLLGSAVTDALRNGIRLVRHEVGGVRQQVTTLHRAIVKPIQGELRALERWTYPKVRHAAHEVDVAIPRDIAGLRARSRTIENGLADAWDLIRKHEGLLGIGALTGVVAVALSRLGLGWTRCDKVGRLGRAGCALDSDLLEGLLAGTLAIVGTVSVVEFIREMQAVEDEMIDALRGFIRELP